MGLAAASFGFALFWRVLLTFDSPKKRFWIGTIWFAATQLIQLSWSLSHLFLYIIAVYLFFAIATGLQFGVLALMFDQKKIKDPKQLLLIASVWTLMEWARLFFMSGYTWNPVGLSLSSSVFSMQMASIWGVFGLTFWVMITNLFALQSMMQKSKKWIALWGIATITPYLYGAVQIQIVDSKPNSNLFHAVLTQPSFAVEEAMEFQSTEEFIGYVEGEWKQILSITKSQLGKPTDLVVLPEFVVPFGTYTMIFPYEVVKSVFEEIYGDHAKLPPLESPYARKWNGEWYVNNAFWAQAISESFSAGLIAGLEDVDVHDDGKRDYWSAGIYFQPEIGPTLSDDRYAKRVLVPMGEYIPLEFCRKLAANYGVTGSFTPGKGAKVWDCNGNGVGVSICYEETFGDLMRENKQLGASMLVNLTSDAWYPNSRLTQQHSDHARLRTVENGFPLLRSCNTGITGAYDSLGREIAILGKGKENFEMISDAIRVEVPMVTYWTLYSEVGDGLIVGFCLISIIFTYRNRRYDQ